MNLKSILITGISLFILNPFQMQGQNNNPVFTHFRYEGNDSIYRQYPLNGNEFYSPILQGFYPDPSITRKGNDYYLVNSTFSFYPGVPIFHSTDLVNWKQIGHILDRPSQLKLDGLEMREGIYAPDIIYNHYNDTFYMVTTLVGGRENFVVKAKDPAGPWSDPIQLPIEGIDPSLFFDDNGKAYIVHNDAPEKALYDGHRAIKIWEYDVETDQVKGPGKIIVDGGVDISQKPVWIEGPHLYKKNGWYYLMCAEGGTAEDHREVIFRSASPTGPYIPAEKNPILTQMDLPADRPNPVTCAGHADIIETPQGDHYGVFLACRPNTAGRTLTGRETFILPVNWKGDFPVYEGGLKQLNIKQELPAGVINQTGKDDYLPNGNFIFEDRFEGNKLDYRWIAVRGPYDEFISHTENGIRIIPNTNSVKSRHTPSMICYRQQHNTYTATTSLEYTPETEKDLAGIVCFQNDEFNYIFGITRKDDRFYIILEKTGKGNSELIASTPIPCTEKPIQLQIEADGDNIRFNYALDNNIFLNLGGDQSSAILSTDIAGGFTGCVIGLYATSANEIKSIR